MFLFLTKQTENLKTFKKNHKYKFVFVFLQNSNCQISITIYSRSQANCIPSVFRGRAVGTLHILSPIHSSESPNMPNSEMRMCVYDRTKHTENYLNSVVSYHKHIFSLLNQTHFYLKVLETLYILSLYSYPSINTKGDFWV